MKSVYRIALVLVAVAIAIAGIVLVRSCTAAPVPAASDKSLPRPLPDYASYRFSQGDGDKVIDLAYPAPWSASSLVTQCFLHDRVLQSRLQRLGWQLRGHPFATAVDMIPFIDGRLKVMLMGDIAAFKAVAARGVQLFAAPRIGTNVLITKRSMPLAGIKGLRIGYVPGTVGHFTLDQALHAAHLGMADVTALTVPYAEMEAGLAEGTVDAVSSVNALPILKGVPGSSIVFKTASFAYLAIDGGFAEGQAAVVRELLAAVVRAANWARQDDAHVLTILSWIRQAEIDFRGVSDILPNADWLSALRAETIDSPTFPLLPLESFGDGSLPERQIGFMKRTGLLPAGASWDRIKMAFHTRELPSIIEQGESWETRRFDYSR